MNKDWKKYYRPDILRVGEVDIDINYHNAIFIKSDIVGIEDYLDDDILVIPNEPLHVKYSDGEYWISKKEENG